MRSFVVLLLAIAGFIAFSLRTHQRSDRVTDGEEKVPARIRVAGKLGVRPNLPAQDGYAYEWLESNDEQPILIARPVQPGRTGARWFATMDGVEVYEFDTTLFQAGDNGPAPVPIRRFLGQPADKRDSTKAPTGWKPVPQTAGP